MVEIVENYQFRPEHLKVAERKPGISAFLRTRDGGFCVEQAVRSHIDLYDEIVAVHNRCQDKTPEILARLEQEFGPKLRVFHYLPPVFPQGSEGHIREAADSPLSVINYSNFALAQTSYRHVTKLDDDHIAMPEHERLVADVRSGRAAQGEMAAFSGLNLALDAHGSFGILAREPFSGSGDIGIFPVGPGTHFHHNRKFEAMHLGGMRRRWHSFVYWHVKYLKPGMGFANYDLEENPNSRFARKRARHLANRAVISLAELQRRTAEHPRLLTRLCDMGLPVPQRDCIIAARDHALVRLPPELPIPPREALHAIAE